MSICLSCVFLKLGLKKLVARSILLTGPFGEESMTCDKNFLYNDSVSVLTDADIFRDKV